MKTGCLINSASGELIIKRAFKPTNFFERGRGLLARKQLTRDEAMLIIPCNSIHTFFMKYPLDIVFLDQNLKVTSLHHNIKPWRLCSSFKSSNVLELRTGSIDKLSLHLSQQLEFKESST